MLGRERWSGNLGPNGAGECFEAGFREYVLPKAPMTRSGSNAFSPVRAVNARLVHCLMNKPGALVVKTPQDKAELETLLEQIETLANEIVRSTEADPMVVASDATVLDVIRWVAHYKVVRAEVSRGTVSDEYTLS